LLSPNTCMSITTKKRSILRLTIVALTLTGVAFIVFGRTAHKPRGEYGLANDLPRGAVGGYYPELNPLVPLAYHEELSKTPAYKGVPVRIVAG